MSASEDDGHELGIRGWNVGSLSSETSDDEDQDMEDEPPKKKPKATINSDQDPPTYNAISSKLMAKMGYIEGEGLGKNKQGRTGIVEASTQRGRRGLGLQVKGFEQDEGATWDFEAEQITAEETIEWMPENHDPIPDADTMRSWLKIGNKLKEAPLTSEFCNDEVVEKVVECKSVFDNLENEEMRRARTKSNPFETIRGAIFQNRAAMKMANMDAILDFMFTDPKDENGHPMLHHHELLYFADICAGPGGFSEYVLWRKKCTAKGFGFTLKGSNDFKLHEFYSAPSELFEPHYGADDDGDIYKPKNLYSFRDFVFESTDGKGVHFVMGDGGFSVEGQENLQEIKSNRLYLCQFLCALSILRPHGHFVCKLFDIFTNYSVGLIYLMYLAFKHVSIFKPVTSRPANSERYIICKSKRPNSQPIQDYMFQINDKFEEISSVLSDKDIEEVVDLDVMKQNKPFTDYIITSNETLGEIQSKNLEKIRVFAQNPNLHDMKQAELREECLKRWGIPDQVRAAPSKEEHLNRFQRLISDKEPIDIRNTRLLSPSVLKSIHSRYDYKFLVVGGEQRCLIMSAGRSLVYMLNEKNTWTKLMMKNIEVKVEIPRDTILEVELVYELKGEGKGQRKNVAMHILDALVIYGENIQKLSYEMRMYRARLLCKALDKPTRPDLATVRVKELFDLCDLSEYYHRLEKKVVKGSGVTPRTCYKTNSDMFFVPRGLMIVKIVKEPWMLAHSRSSGKVYYFHTMTKQAVYEFPDEARLSYHGHLRERMIIYRLDPFINIPQANECVTEETLRGHLAKLPP